MYGIDSVMLLGLGVLKAYLRPWGRPDPATFMTLVSGWQPDKLHFGSFVRIKGTNVLMISWLFCLGPCIGISTYILCNMHRVKSSKVTRFAGRNMSGKFAWRVCLGRSAHVQAKLLTIKILCTNNVWGKCQNIEYRWKIGHLGKIYLSSAKWINMLLIFWHTRLMYLNEKFHSGL